MEQANSLPQLTAEEQRVLGVLIEKSRATPEYYPMTINALQTACNQKTSRNPVVNYDEEIVTATINALKKRGLVSTVTGGGSRTVKYKHNIAIQYPLIPAELSIICLLLLRGPQTPGEINNNAGRLFEFESIEEVLEHLTKLAGQEPPFVVQLPRQPGQKEQRYIHLLGESAAQEMEKKSESHSADLENRVKLLEEEVLYLRTHLDKLLEELL